MKKTSYQVLREKYKKLLSKYARLCDIILTIDYDKNTKEQLKYAFLSLLYLINKE